LKLEWPRETAVDAKLAASRWHHPGSNYCLDFHGDPVNAELCVYSDGNHHMALEECLESFRGARRLQSIFYCTTPPSVYLDWLYAGGMEIGNLRLSRPPDLVIGPQNIVDDLRQSGSLRDMRVFAASLGNHLLVARGNPHGIAGVGDLLRPEVRLFVSNPETEKASHQVYRETIEALARGAGIDGAATLFESRQTTRFGELIHHREAPQAIADGEADAAIVYAHLALRYKRIFPQLFDIVELPTGEDNVVSRYAVGLAHPGDGLAEELFAYFAGAEVAEIYRRHGLQALDG